MMRCVCCLRRSNSPRRCWVVAAPKCSWLRPSRNWCVPFHFTPCLSFLTFLQARSTPGKVSAAIEMLAVALRRIPAILSDNAGKNFLVFFRFLSHRFCG